MEPSSWLPSRDIALLTPREIEAFLSDSKKKKGDLFEAYSVAKDPVEWNRHRADAQAEWKEMQAQLANEEDQLASDGDEPKGEGKKRKRPAQADKAGKGADKKKASKAKKVSNSCPQVERDEADASWSGRTTMRLRPRRPRLLPLPVRSVYYGLEIDADARVR